MYDVFNFMGVESRANFRNVDDKFEHLVGHAMSCTLESSAEYDMVYGLRSAKVWINQ